jgi:hypothetical protein
MDCQLISLGHADFFIELLLSDCLYVSYCLFKYIQGLVRGKGLNKGGGAYLCRSPDRGGSTYLWGMLLIVLVKASVVVVGRRWVRTVRSRLLSARLTHSLLVDPPPLCSSTLLPSAR